MEHQWSQLSDPVGLSTKSHAGEACEISCTYKNQRQLKFLSLEHSSSILVNCAWFLCLLKKSCQAAIYAEVAGIRKGACEVNW